MSEPPSGLGGAPHTVGRRRAAGRRRHQRRAIRPGDRVFRGLSQAAGAMVLVDHGRDRGLPGLPAVPALREPTPRTSSPTRSGSRTTTPPRFGIAALLFGTLMRRSSHADRGAGRARRSRCSSRTTRRAGSAALGFIVDLLAAVPSWSSACGASSSSTRTSTGLTQWLRPASAGSRSSTTDRTSSRQPVDRCIAGLVLAIMILPIVSSLSPRGVPAGPAGTSEAALALGATRWEMIRTAVLPFGRAGHHLRGMLGLGRALGETIAVALVLVATCTTINLHITEPGGEHLRLQHRAEVRRGRRDRQRRADRLRAGAVRHHAGRST